MRIIPSYVWGGILLVHLGLCSLLWLAATFQSLRLLHRCLLKNLFAGYAVDWTWDINYLLLKNLDKKLIVKFTVTFASMNLSLLETCYNWSYQLLELGQNHSSVSTCCPALAMAPRALQTKCERSFTWGLAPFFCKWYLIITRDYKPAAHFSFVAQESWRWRHAVSETFFWIRA